MTKCVLFATVLAMRTVKLTPKQSAFCREYIKDHNGRQAAIRAGYASPTANVAASKLVTKGNVRAEIARLEAKTGRSEDAAIIDRNEIIRELRKIAYGDIRRTRTKDDEVMRIVDMAEDVTAGIEEVTEIETSIGSSRKIKLHSKLAAIKELAKLGGLYPETGTGEGVRLSFSFDAGAQTAQDSEQQGAETEAGVSITLPTPDAN